MFRFVKDLFGFTTPRRPGRGFHPRLEALEDRQALSVSVGIDPQAPGTLVITGDAAANRVKITQFDELVSPILRVESINGQFATKEFDSSQIAAVRINLLGGDDYLLYDTGSDYYFFAKEITVNLGQGNDRTDLSFFNGTSLKPILKDLAITVRAGRGKDHLEANFGIVPAVGGGHDVSLTALMGRGKDNAFCFLWGDLQAGSSMQLDLRGGLGSDRLSFDAGTDFYTVDNHSPEVDVAAGALLDVRLRGQAGVDNLMFEYSGDLDGSVVVQAIGGTEDDEVSVDMNFVTLNLDFNSAGSVDALVKGGSGDDDLTLVIDENFPLDGLAVTAGLNGGEGNDSVTTSSNVVVGNVP